MKKLFCIMLLLGSLLLWSCVGAQNIEEAENSEKNFDSLSFDLTYQELLENFSNNNLQYCELGTDSFDENEKLTSGVIYMSDNEFEICRVKVRTYNDRIFQVYLNYDVSGDEVGYDKFPVIIDTVALAIKPDLPKDYIDLDKYSDNFYSKDYQDLRISLTNSDKYLGYGITGTAVDCYFVHLDFVD